MRKKEKRNDKMHCGASKSAVDLSNLFLVSRLSARLARPRPRSRRVLGGGPRTFWHRGPNSFGGRGGNLAAVSRQRGRQACRCRRWGASSPVGVTLGGGRARPGHWG